MSDNLFDSKRELIVFLFVSVLIVLSIQLIFSSSTNEDSFPALVNSYNIGAALSESDALELIEKETIVSALKKNNMFILKTEQGEYFQASSSDSLRLGLSLEGVVVDTSSDGFGFPFWLSILIGALLISSAIRLAFYMYREVKLAEAAKHLAYQGMFDGGMSDVSSDDVNPSDTNESVKIKKITFADVQGIDELKPDLYRLVDCLKNPEKYTNLGARMPKGVVLYGPPGTGKTLTAKALAGEANVPFYSVCASDFMEKYVGVGASRVRDLYAKARKHAPCIIFIDEIDAIGGGRGEFNSSEKDQTINALLAELDGFKDSPTVLTICATNRLDILDPALLRAGRFDLKLAVGLPDKDGREQILKLHSLNKKLSDNISIENLAKKTVGFSGAELENLLNEGALIAADCDKEFIDFDDIENAFFKIIMDGNKKKRKEIDAEAYLTAYHEAGHVLATKLLTTDGVPTVTIIQSTSGAGGVTFMNPDESTLPSKKYLRSKIKVYYAGRAAEELYLGSSDDITTGASHDIKQATSVLKSYIGAYGMGEQGLIDIKQLTTQYDIIVEASALSTVLYAEVLKLLKDNFEKLKLLADALIEKESLYEEDIDAILGIQPKLSILKDE